MSLDQYEKHNYILLKKGKLKQNIDVLLTSLFLDRMDFGRKKVHIYTYTCMCVHTFT